MGKNVSKSSFARANQDRDYSIFEEFTFYLVNEVQRNSFIDTFKLDGNVCAFDSTTIDLCLAVFWWEKFRKKKGEVKVHTLHDVETQIPTFFHITTASTHDFNAMSEIPYVTDSYYILDRAHNMFSQLLSINQIVAYFVIRAKKNVQYIRSSLPCGNFQEQSFRLRLLRQDLFGFRFHRFVTDSKR
jgi:hypothetical protein